MGGFIVSVPEIIVYSSTGCPYCEKVKTSLAEWGFEYEERNATILNQTNPP
jgi:thioredoxin reductase (NADPH)